MTKPENQFKIKPSLLTHLFIYSIKTQSLYDTHTRVTRKDWNHKELIPFEIMNFTQQINRQRFKGNIISIYESLKATFLSVATVCYLLAVLEWIFHPLLTVLLEFFFRINISMESFHDIFISNFFLFFVI